jgi:hypothetical protein
MLDNITQGLERVLERLMKGQCEDYSGFNYSAKRNLRGSYKDSNEYSGGTKIGTILVWPRDYCANVRVSRWQCFAIFPNSSIKFI